jgi:TRAP-type mannitol/chloroaromatic compound transport system substrate-binding protein
MDKLSPHPSRDKWPVTNNGADVPQPWNRWFDDLRTKLNALIQTASDTATISNITEIETRNHEDLQNLNTDSYSHLTSSQAVELTGASNTELHYHKLDRIYARNCSIGRV